MTLKELQIGQSARITAVGGEKDLRQHFLDMGVIPGAVVKMVKYAPLGDPVQLLIHGYEITFRLADAEKIEVDTADLDGRDDDSQQEEQSVFEISEHPGLGESTPVYHDSSRPSLPKGHLLKFALVGNQNSGKTTLFNQLTGMNQHVGNFPGVTVDSKLGSIKDYPHTEVVDLPGIYSLSPYTSEELVTRQFILDSKPSAIINIVDATNIERNLYLTMQLMELNIPMVVALNMMDELRNNGGTVRINKMEHLLGVPVIPISAIKNEGVMELVEHAVHVARYQELPTRQDFCKATDHGGAVHRSLHGVMHLIEDHALRAGIPIRFAGSKLVEGDELVRQALQLNETEEHMVELILKQLEEERGLDSNAAIAEMRFSFIEDVCRKTVVKPRESKEHLRSTRIDKLLTGHWTALPLFLLIMMFIFWMTFDVIGGNLQRIIDELVKMTTESVDNCFQQWEINEMVRSLVIDGIFGGVGSVISFVPVIVILFFFLSLLEDSGYMARVAFVMDKLLRKIGLSGRSIVPLLIGFGCSVPSVMASRTLPSGRDRKLTVMLTPFMSCTAKLPIYVFFVAIFFPKNGAWVMIGLYLLGIIMGVLMALFMKKTFLSGNPVPFVMELPNYRIPSVITVLRLMWEKAKDFVKRALTVIFLATIVIWFLQSFDYRLQFIQDSHDSILASIAGWIAPLFSPLGLGDWRIVVSLISGVMAKESFVSSFSVLFGTEFAIHQLLDVATVMGLLVFCLLYTPCVVTVATIRHEMGTRYALCLVVWQCLLAWVCAFMVRNLVMWLAL